MTLGCICLGSEPTVRKREEMAEPTVSKREEMAEPTVSKREEMAEPTVSKREEMAEPTVRKREEKPLSASTELGDSSVTFVESAACDEFHGE